MQPSLKKIVSRLRQGRHPIVPVIRLQGTIGLTRSLRTSLNLANIAPSLEKAFSIKRAAAVALIINSPGGSPVQSRLIHDRIRQLAEKYEHKVLVFIEDVAASGGYMLALAGDEIIADESSIVGSIGVVSAGFGFPDLLQRIGVERRIYTSGTNKAILDPFQKENPKHVKHLKSLQEQIHSQFISLVRARRAAKLHDEDDLFSGLFWTGERALEYGLIDRLGHLRPVLQEYFGKNVQLKLIEASRQPFAKRLGIGASEQSALPGAVISALEERTLWARFGL